jgi:hypothetical protein
MSCGGPKGNLQPADRKRPSILCEETRKVISYPGGHAEGFPDTFKQNFAKIYQAIEEKTVEIRDFATFEGISGNAAL